MYIYAHNIFFIAELLKNKNCTEKIVVGKHFDS